MTDLPDRISTFKKQTEQMIATNERAYRNWGRSTTAPIRKYTQQEIRDIINGSSLEAQQKLSRDYFNGDGFYRRVVLYYATLLYNYGLLIPNIGYGQSIKNEAIKKRYFNAVSYVEKMNLQSFFTNCSLVALLDGCYYGIIVKADKNNFSTLDLPATYCRTNFKDDKGNDIIEFNTTYFTSILNAADRENCLKLFPKEVQRHYKKFINGKIATPWVYIPVDKAICFPFFDNGRPLFLTALPSIIDYDDSVEVEKAGQIEKIKKIIVQKIPHLTDGTLLFEPEEAAVMHDGAVNMMKQNEYVSVLTSYADVDAIVSKTAAEANNNNLEKMLANIYNEFGVSGELFASTSNLAIKYSVKNDMSLMRILSNKFERFVSNVINNLYSNSNINFKYKILPISQYNEDDYLKIVMQLAQNGYSLLMPALCVGMSQKDIISIKDLENDLLKITDKLRPPQNSYTQSGNSTQIDDEKKNGAPEKKPEDQTTKTEQNKKSIEKNGGD